METKNVLFIICTLFLFISIYPYFIPTNSFECIDGYVASGASQDVCLMEHVVVKKMKPCTSLSEYKCHLKHVKQGYTNRKWFEVLNNHRAIAKIKQWTPLSFERTNHVDIAPNCTENLLRLTEIDKLLYTNGLIITDVNQRYNLVLDQSGFVVLIDFNIFPAISRPLIDKFDSLSQPLSPFNNIYGIAKIDTWIYC